VEIRKQARMFVMDKVLDDGNEVLEGQVYDFAELEHVDRGLVPKSVDDEIMD
jgi:hypothetical protein